MSLLTPGTHRRADLLDDHAFIAAMIEVEHAWLSALSENDVVDAARTQAFAAATDDWFPNSEALAAAAESAGNPVVPLVSRLRELAGDAELAAVIHRGLTSQDVLDTALMLQARAALNVTCADLSVAAGAAADLAARHRDTVMAGRTLGRYAVPITLGLKVAQWLSGLLDALELVDRACCALPVQCGGAAGTLALLGEMSSDPQAVVAAFARNLGLRDPGLPWHTMRTPITRIGDACTTSCDALGVIAADVLLLSRPEIDELREAAVSGRGGSSTMPHKHNPVLAVLIRRTALRAPQLNAQLHLAAAEAVDERPDGAWHTEWQPLTDLLCLTATAAAQAAELLWGLEVNHKALARHVDEGAADLLAERGAPGTDPADYTGSAGHFVDRVLARFAAYQEEHR